MRKLLLILAWMMTTASWATTYTEFYVQSTGNNLNAGSTTNDAAQFTYAGGTFVASTGVFTPATENPSSDGVQTNTWASIYTTSGATNANFVARITDVTTTNLTVSLTAIGGAVANVSESGGATTCKIGGAWKGPNTNEVLSAGYGHPFKIVVGTMTNYGGYIPCVNFRNDTRYYTTNTITIASSGPMLFSGYSSSLRDGGRVVIDGGGVYPSYNLILATGSGMMFTDFEFATNGASGALDLVRVNGGQNTFQRCIFHDGGKAGLYFSGSDNTAESCEAYKNNRGNSSNGAGFTTLSSGFWNFCISHDNTGGANAHGFLSGSIGSMSHCIAYNNVGHGFIYTASGKFRLVGCDFYNNTLSGIDLSSASIVELEVLNCNFIKNGAYGINSSGSSKRIGLLLNSKYGAGTMVNASGWLGPNCSSWGVIESGTAAYASDVTPWTDPANGNFKISLAAAKAAGYGVFTQSLVNSPTNTVAYPDIGAAQSAGGGEHSHVFAQ